MPTHGPVPQPATAAWDELPLGVQQQVLVLSANPCVRRVSRAFRAAFDAANDTLRWKVFEFLQPVATAAAGRVVKNSTSLTAVSLLTHNPYTLASALEAVSSLLAAGATSGLATRLRKLTGIAVGAESIFQQLQALQQCTSLTHLDISGSQLGLALDQQGHFGANMLAATLQGMRRLTFLDLGSCRLQSQHAAALASALHPLTQLQHLHLRADNLREAGLLALAPTLAAMPGLQTLNIGFNIVEGAAGAQALCALLGAVPELTHLDIRRNRLREDAALLAPVLRSLTCLRILHMSYVGTGDRRMLTLAPVLTALPHLHTLDVSGNELGSEAMSALQPVLAREGTPLRKLDLSDNCFSSEGRRALAAALSAASHLHELDLRHTYLRDEGWKALAPALSRLGPCLRSLKLADEILGREGIAAAAGALQALTGLTHLEAAYLSESQVMAALAPALTGMRRLQVLALPGNQMGYQGTAAFAAVLPSFAGSLKHLGLRECSIAADAAASDLAPALALATGLTELRLSCNLLGPQGAQWLAPLLSALPYLRTVELCACRLGLQGCMAIVRALEERDGVAIRLAGNGVPSGSAGESHLLNMPGIKVYL